MDVNVLAVAHAGIGIIASQCHGVIFRCAVGVRVVEIGCGITISPAPLAISTLVKIGDVGERNLLEGAAFRLINGEQWLNDIEVVRKCVAT